MTPQQRKDIGVIKLSEVNWLDMSDDDIAEFAVVVQAATTLLAHQDDLAALGIKTVNDLHRFVNAVEPTLAVLKRKATP